MNKMIIRDAFPNDFDAIANCVSAAFDNEGEVVLVQQLRADNDVVIELVAEEAGAIVGHVVVSHLSLNPDLGLCCGGVAPLSVLPGHQSTGIGSQLMETVIEKVQTQGWTHSFYWVIPRTTIVLGLKSRTLAVTTQPSFSRPLN